MAVSSSRDYSVTGTNIINGAFEYIGMKDTNESMSAELTAQGLAVLERMIKLWEAEGIGLWTLAEAALFQSYEGYTYNIYSSGTNCSTTWVKTEVATAGTAADLTLVVDSITGMTTGDYVGIELDDGTVQWTTINGVPASATITLTAALTDSAAVDNHVYTYTTKCPRPIEITEARIHHADGTDTPLSIISREEYMALSDKTSTGTANQIYFNSQLSYVTANIWPACSDVQDYIKMTVKLSIMDMDAVGNNPEFPQEFYEALETNLAVRLGEKNGRPLSPVLATLAISSKQIATDFDRENVSTFISVRRR
jgi:hypothetical protein